MKITKQILTWATVACLTASSALASSIAGMDGSTAHPYVINIAGSTAFRAGTNQAIKAALGSCTHAYSNDGNSGTYTDATYNIFSGTVGTGTNNNYIIRTNWTKGSLSGLTVLNAQTTLAYFPVATVMSSGVGTPYATSAATENDTMDLALSDVLKSNVSALKSANLNAASGGIAILPFVFVKSKDASTIAPTFTSITPDAFKALASSGNIPLSWVTGNSADSTKLVFLTGRKDSSGTRLVIFATTGFGYTSLAKQFKVGQTGGQNTAITSLTLWPAGDSSPVDYVSKQFNTDTLGNGGYDTGLRIGDALGSTNLNSISVTDKSGTRPIGAGTAIVVGYVGTDDAYYAMHNSGAEIVGYNGVTITPTASDITGSDKVYSGQYALWSLEQLYWKGTSPTYLTAFVTPFKTAAKATLGNIALDVDLMQVARQNDGGVLSINQ